jgi:hypothetical protein
MKHFDPERSRPQRENIMGDVYLGIAIAGVNTLVAMMGAAVVFVLT